MPKDLSIDVDVTQVEPMVTFIDDINSLCVEVEELMETEDISIEAIELFDKLLKIRHDLAFNLEQKE